MRIHNEATIIAESKRIQSVLEQIEASIPKDLTASNLGTLVAQAETQTATTKKLKSELAAAVDAKKATFDAINDFLKRVKSGAKAAFGDDSLEYERVGGKRTSDRKRPSRKNQQAA